MASGNSPKNPIQSPSISPSQAQPPKSQVIMAREPPTIRTGKTAQNTLIAILGRKTTVFFIDSPFSRFARRGAGSAARSVTGGFSKWKMGLTDEDSYATQLAGEDLAMGMVVAVVPAFKQTEDAHREALTSPFFHARLAEMPRLIAEMELAIRNRDVGKICALAERDTLMLHGITMTGTGEMVLWRPDTLRVILAVRRLREQGVPAFFSIDTGATVYVNTFPDRVDAVRERIEEMGLQAIPCTVGGPARPVDEPLF